MIYQFENIRVDTWNYSIHQSKRPVPLPRQEFDLLVLLIENANRVVGREELMQRLWPGKIVSDAALATRLKAIRKALGDSGREQRLIKTIHGRGFRFVGHLSEVHPETEQPIVEYHEGTPREFPAIAIMPCVILGEADRLENLCQGLAIDLNAELSRYSELYVLGNHAGAGFDPDPDELEVLSERYNLRYLLDSHLREFPDQIVMTVNLIEIDTRIIIWSARFETGLAPTASKQQSIINSIVTNVAGKVSSYEIARRRHRPTHDFSAYDHYLSGLHKEMYSEDGHVWLISHRHFQTAVERDPNFVAALAELAISHIALSYFGSRYDASMDAAFRYATRALSLDASNANAHAAMLMVCLDSGDHERAEHHMEQALALNSNDKNVLTQCCMLLANTGRTERAIELGLRSLDHDPFHHDSLYDALAEAYFHGGHYAKAIATYNRLTAMPFWVHGQLAASHAQLGHCEQARRHADRMLATLPPEFSPDDEIDWALNRLTPAECKTRLIESYRKAGLIDGRRRDDRSNRPIEAGAPGEYRAWAPASRPESAGAPPRPTPRER